MIGTGRLASKLSIAVTALALLPWASAAQQPKGVLSRLDDLVFTRPELRVVETNREVRSPEADPRSAAAVESFLAQHGPAWSVWVDQRRGRPSLLDGGAIPFLPGPANGLSWEEFAPGCRDYGCIPVARAEHEARAFLERWRDLLGVKPEEFVLDPAGSMPVGGSYYFLRFQWAPGGIPVEGASVYFRINGGNLLQVATTQIGDLKLDLAPVLSPETAWQILAGYLGDSLTSRDEVLEPGRLVILPVTPAGMDPERYGGAYGSQIGYRLCYRLAFRRPGVIGTWAALVDAHTGELQRFVDSNRYGQIHGTLYLDSAQSNPQDRPFPYAGTNLPTPDDYADAAGRYGGTAATVDLGQGRYVQVHDSCGATDLTTADGDAGYGQSAGTDCGTPSPNPGGGGNTWSSKTAYYYLTFMNRKVAAFLPDNAWLDTAIPAYVNEAGSCNGYADASSVHYLRSGSSCTNLGENPATVVHEWGHALDFNDGSGGMAPPCETVADWVCIVQLRDSCRPRGAYPGTNCDGSGDACTDCDGFRDADYAKHASNTPWTAQNHGSVWDCGLGWYNGPCGWEDHCESGIAAQALWDFVNRDLPGDCGISGATAWQLAEALFFPALPSLGDLYSCTVGSPMVTDGCGGASLYTLMRVLDDSGDGTANGTPHAKAIYHALARHNIACGAEGDAKNQNQSTCPALLAPALSSAVAHDRVSLSWSSGGAPATRYFVYKNDDGPDRGYTRIATVYAPSRTVIDTAATDGITSYYQVQAATDLDACAGPLSNVTAATPAMCFGVPILDRTAYLCSQTVTVTVEDLTVAAPVTVTAWSTTDPSPVTVTLAQTPPGSARYVGTFQTSPAAGAGKVRVSHGDTLTVRYVDPDFCGSPNVTEETSATIDCQPPVISGVGVSNVTGSSAIVIWTTDEASNSHVQYTPPTGSASSSALTTRHAVEISGLSPCTSCTFDVSSLDAQGNGASDNGHIFTTPPNLTPTLTRTPNQAIPDADLTGAWSALTVTEGRTILDLDVGVTIQHTRVGDLRLTLTDPDGVQIPLSAQVGGSGDNYTGTLFDDEAGTPIAQGSAPFTGHYRPASPLSAVDGKNASGNWRLTAIDIQGGETGTVLEWSLRFTYPAYSCGSELAFQEVTLLADACDRTGGGSGDGILDAGEEATLRVGLTNNGSVTATQVSGSLSSSSPWVTITDATSAFSEILPAGTGFSVSPHLRIRVAPEAPCGTVLEFALHVTCWEDPSGWDESFALKVGEVTPGPPVPLFSESFTGSSLPAGWASEVVNDAGGRFYITYDGSCGSEYALRHLSNQSPADVWVHTSAVSLSAGVPHTLTFVQWTEDAEAGHSLSIWLGTAQEAASMSELLWSETGLADPSCTVRTAQFTPGATGTYYLGIHCTSPPGQHSLFVDDLLLTYASPGTCDMNVCCPDSAAPAPGAEDDEECDSTGVRITWAPVPDATAYDLEVDGTAVIPGVTSPYIHLPGDADSHGFRVRAIQGICEGAWSETVSAADLNLTPGTPAAPGATDLDVCALTGVQVTWEAVAGATGYDALVDGTTLAGGVTSPYTHLPGNSSTHIYQVRAMRSTCKGDWSAATAAGDAINVGTPAPPTVTDLDPCAQSGVSVSWSAVPGATGYDLVLDGSDVFADVTSPLAFDPHDTAVHGYSIQAKASGCTGERSNPTEKADLNKSVAVPTSLRSNDLNACLSSGIRVTWDPVSGATGYDLYVDERDILPDVTSPCTHLPGNNDSHSYRVRAKTDSCSSAWSDLDSAADGNLAVATVSAPSVTDISACAPTGVSIAWTAVAHATAYDLRVDGTTTISGVTSPRVHIPGNSDSHSYEVRGRNASCTGSWSTAVARSDQDNTPGAPNITSVLDSDPGQSTGVQVNFTAGAGATRHDLFRDGTKVVNDYSSGATYVPGDSGVHTYVVQAWKLWCTADSNAVQGTDGPQVPPPEVAPGDTAATAQSWPDKTTQTWPGNSSCSSGYLLYRGTLADMPQLADGDEDSCLRFRGYSAGENAKTGLTEDPSEVPGRLYWYVVTGLNGAGEGAAGAGSSGQRVMDLGEDCLTP